MTIRSTLSVTFDPDFYREIRAFSQSHGMSVSKLLREGVAIYMKLAQGKTPLERRRIVRDEFMMLAIEYMLLKDSEAIRDELFAEAERRAGAFNVAA